MISNRLILTAKRLDHKKSALYSFEVYQQMINESLNISFFLFM